LDTLRLRLIKIAARVVEMKPMIRVHLMTSCSAQHIFKCWCGRPESNRHRPRGPTDFHTTTAFAA
jgi:hypothetical protein